MDVDRLRSRRYPILQSATNVTRVSIRSKIIVGMSGVVLATLGVLCIVWLHVQRLQSDAGAILKQKELLVSAVGSIQGQVAQAVGATMEGVLASDPAARGRADEIWQRLDLRLEQTRRLANGGPAEEQLALVRDSLKLVRAHGQSLLELTVQRDDLCNRFDLSYSSLHNDLHGRLEQLGRHGRDAGPTARLESAVETYAVAIKSLMIGPSGSSQRQRVPDLPERLKQLNPDDRGSWPPELLDRAEELGALGNQLLAVDTQRDRMLRNFSSGSLALDRRIEQILVPTIQGRAARIAALAAKYGREEILAILAIGTCLVLLTGLVSLHITRRMSRGTEVLTDGARRLAEGDFTWRVQMTGEDEFAQQAQRFNEMAERLALREDQSRQIRLQLGREVTLRTRQIDEHRQKLQSMALQLSVAEDASRRKIASDLHDQVSQTLVAAMTRLDMTLHDVPAQHRAQLEAVYAMIDQVLGDVRSLTFQLCPPMLHDLGLAAGLRWLADQYDGQDDLEVRFSQSGPEPTLSDQQRSDLFRCCRELLINVAKHAGASEVCMELSGRADRVEICVRDNGVGFAEQSIAASPAVGGFGLRDIRQRIEMQGGSVSIQSCRGNGARVNLWIPLGQGQWAGDNRKEFGHAYSGSAG